MREKRAKRCLYIGEDNSKRGRRYEYVEKREV